MRDKNDEEEEENCLNEVENKEEYAFAFCERGGSAPRRTIKLAVDNKDDQQKRWAFETAANTSRRAYAQKLLTLHPKRL